jgi:hypothetical protein
MLSCQAKDPLDSVMSTDKLDEWPEWTIHLAKALNPDCVARIASTCQKFRVGGDCTGVNAVMQALTGIKVGFARVHGKLLDFLNVMGSEEHRGKPKGLH